MKLLPITLLITVTACGTPAPRPATPEPAAVSQSVIEQEQEIALAIVDEIRVIENTPAAELSIADKSRRQSLYSKLKSMRGNHIFKGRSAEHLSWQELEKAGELR